MCSPGNAGVNEGNKVGNGVTVDVGAIVGVRVGLGVKVERKVGVCEGVGVKVEIGCVEMTASIGSGFFCSGGDFGLVRTRMDATRTMMNTTPRMLIKMICRDENF